MTVREHPTNKLSAHETADEIYQTAETSGPPTLDNGLINGTNVYGELGARFNMSVETGQSYRLRLVNGAIDTHFKFMIDGHNLSVIAMDFVPIVPYSTNVLSIGMGQRYDVVFTANATSDNYWIRAIPQTYCSDNDNADNIKGVLTYSDATYATPESDAYDYTDNCDDEALTDLVPYLALDASSSSTTDDEAVTVGKSGNFFKWYMAATTFVSEWDYPTVLAIADDNTTWSDNQHVISLPDANEWVYMVIETTQTVPHPIHLHGHDFYILAQDTGTYDADTTTLSLTNPPRRDVAMLPASGYLVIAWYTDNPGAWLLHCHIGWHTEEGFALQLVEQLDVIETYQDSDTINSTCIAWSAYATTDSIVQDDSGV